MQSFEYLSQSFDTNGWGILLALVIPSVVAFCAVWFATPWAGKVARLLGAMDQPGGRRVHTVETPRMGGLAIALGAGLGVSAVLWIPGFGLGGHMPLIAIFLATIGIFTLGFIDDFMGLSAGKKMIVQVALASACWFGGVRIHAVSLPYDGVLDLATPIGFILTVGWIVGVTNAINLLDGLDGLASGVVSIAAATMVICHLGGTSHSVTLIATGCALSAACLGFLIHNSHPAKIFMGDTGSLFIGFVIANVSVLSSTKSNTITALGVPLIALGVPIADTLIAFTRRILQGRSPFVADRNHLHHILQRVGVTRAYAVRIIHIGTGVLCISAVAAQLYGDNMLFYGLLSLAVGLLWMMILVRKHDAVEGYHSGEAERESMAYVTPSMPMSAVRGQEQVPRSPDMNNY